MNTHAGKGTENKTQASAGLFSQKREEGESPITDDRPEAIYHDRLQQTANNSPQARQLKSMQAIMRPAAGTVQQQAQTAEAAATQTAPVVQKANRTGLPDALKAGLESLSGYSMDDVNVHYNSAKPAQLQAYAYAQGTDIHLGPGQERHLPHEAWHVVQQKQGRVRPTLQLKDKTPVNDDTGLEKEADLMGAKALSQKSQGTDAGYARGGVPNVVVQRAMGMEIELGRGVSSPAGNKLEGDEHIIEEAYFNLVTDSRGGVSNIEFVMHHFNQHTGDEPAALLQLTQRLDAMKALYDLIVGEATGTKKLSQVAGGYHYAATPIRSKTVNETTAPDEVILMAPDAGAHDLYVQYTIGFDLSKISQATEDIKDHSYNHVGQDAKGHADDARTFTTGLMTGILAGVNDAGAVGGFLTLAYLQVAAFADAIQGSINKLPGEAFPTHGAVARSPGQIKNKTILLSRVTLQKAYDSLQGNAKQTLEDNQDAILDAMAAEMEKKGMSFAEGAVRQVGTLAGITLLDYAKSGLEQGGQDVEQQRVFGGMRETGIDASVPGNRGIPLELRSFNGPQISWADMVENAKDLLKYTRNLHP